jgi:hypothetical protein
MFQIPVGDGSLAVVEGPLDPSLPLVLLIPGMGGTAADMTSPLSARAYAAYDKTASYPPYSHAGFNIVPPVIPVAGYFGDPPITSVTSWKDALVSAGFSTVSYEPSAPNGTLAQNVAQLTGFAAGSLTSDSRVNQLQVAILAHSRGGIVARAVLAGIRTNPAIAAFVGRTKALVTLHSPHQGSSLATVAMNVDAMAAKLQEALAVLNQPSPDLLSMLRAYAGNPAFAELAPGSPQLSTISAMEPVAGIAYHTFGGTSTLVQRLWQRAYTPDSFIPLPLPFPLFHWATTPLPLGTLLDPGTFVPSQILLPLPLMTEAIALMAQLASSLPELRNGAGDILVADAAAHLPFSASRTTNALNHAEALWDPMLQRQVLAILAQFHIPAPRHEARASISPYPASTALANHVVSAHDVQTGVALAGDVAITSALGAVVMRARTGEAFQFGFKPTRRRVFDPETRTWTVELVYPTVRVTFDDQSYHAVDVDIGRDA